MYMRSLERNDRPPGGRFDHCTTGCTLSRNQNMSS
ncbi:hypothetical protein dsat_2426 [Alkalidesulfovibrio alkalitolerans DSM 16529]|uniref:Uncharacterized protein n=1 Tax=Alkalidesulfovibrio alkalitolerans DSM 16529 TaxID=1121439 RepID=S7URW7_9BACT|nr:hypothetical protein dsat_2426 [Alkalidesulfovibrio alkalitolerans DSM 16529]